MSNTVNNNVQPSVYAFYNAAQEAMSKNKASAVIKAKLGTHDVIVSSASTSRKSTLDTSWNAFEKSLRATFGAAAADKALTAMREASQEGHLHKLSARNISIAFATAQEEFDKGMFVSREKTVDDKGWTVVDHNPFVSGHCEEVSATELLKYADDGDNASDLLALASRGDNPKIKWLADAGGNAVRNIKVAIDGLHGEERQNRVFDFSVRWLDGRCKKYDTLAPILADLIERSGVNDLPEDASPSDVWKTLFRGKRAVPEGLDNLSKLQFTEKLYEVFAAQVKPLYETRPLEFKAMSESSYVKVELDMIVNLMEEHNLTFDGAFCLMSNQLEKLDAQQFAAYKLYDPESAVKHSDGELNAQFRMDYERCGCNCTFGEGKSVVLKQHEYVEGSEGEKKFLEEFEKFTDGMDMRQKRVIGYGLTQAGSFLAGLNANYKHQEPLQKLSGPKEDGSVDLTIGFLSKDGKNMLSYTFNVDVNGNSKLTQIGTVPQE